jgi:hypothetical protein
VNYTLIDRQEAPPMPTMQRNTRRSKRMNELLGELAPGKVAKIELTEDEKAGSVRNQLYQAAVRQGKRVQVWDLEGVLYASLMDGDGVTAEEA